ncbi:MAG: hypothetical protein HY520_00135 [Candidatus Aenigmarchaeota archaeon]|nr:hypothetical protein [Candidatus Aenigmarchaeota archaeon]
MDLEDKEYTHPEEGFMQEKYGTDFGICDHCGRIGVVLLHFHGEWVCHHCVTMLLVAEQKLPVAAPH